MTATTPACVCVSEHRPPQRMNEAHHLWPVGMGGPEHDALLLGLCPTTHDNVHAILRAMVKAGAWMPRSQGQTRYAHAVATLGWQAWDAAGRPAL